ncbi:hypothetical protein Droror1_Dr00002191 [Drosera rotundifolia]
MSKPPRRIVQSLLKLRFDLGPTHFTSNQTPSVSLVRGLSDSSISSLQSHRNFGLQRLISRPISSNGNFGVKSYGLGSFLRVSCRDVSSSGCFKLDGVSRRMESVGGLRFDPFRVRHFSIRASNVGGKVKSRAAKVVEKPLSAVTSAFSRYKEAVGLQIEGFWKRNYLFVVGAGGLALCIFLWRVMFGIANTFVGLSEGMAKYGFLALSASMVAFAGLYVRSRFTINPDKVYRMAMRKLNTSASMLEVMGAPLTGTDLRAYVMSGGGFTMNRFKPRLRSKRCFLIFPIVGSERRGLVSVEVKKKQGKHDMKLLAVDIPMASGPDQRLFLIGDEEEYRIGGGLIGELRDPVVRAMAATKEFEELDTVEEDEDAERELQEAERKHQEDLAWLEREKPCWILGVETIARYALVSCG